MNSDLAKCYELLINSEEFCNWKKDSNVDNPILYCCYFKRNLLQNEALIWTFSYMLDNELDSFEIHSNEIKYIGRSPIVEDKKTEFKELNIHDIKLDYDELNKKISNFTSGENITTVICAITNSNEFGVFWNITQVTSGFDILNFKIDNNGIILSHSKESILKLGKWEKGERNS